MNPGSNVDRFVVNTPGVYTVTFTATWDDDGNSGTRGLFVSQDPVGGGGIKTFAQTGHVSSDGNGLLTQTVTGSLKFDAGDEIVPLGVAKDRDGRRYEPSHREQQPRAHPVGGLDSAGLALHGHRTVRGQGAWLSLGRPLA